jgi:L-lactate dehydrogenase complex protein LldG
VSGARDEILARIRDALADRPAQLPVPRDYRRTTPAGLDVAERFAERVADYRATVHRTTRPELPSVIAAVLRTRGIRQLVVPPGLPEAWLAASGADPVPDDPPLPVHALDAADGVLTGCAVAIAETGTIVLDGGPAQGRRALSLLPDRHVCVVHADQIVGDVPEAIARLEPTRPMTWISGPSATSDIELERVEGVHGPRVLDVIIVGTQAEPAAS